LYKQLVPGYPRKATIPPDPELGGITVTIDGQTTQPQLIVQDKIINKVDVDVVLDANGWEFVFGTGTESILWSAPDGYGYSLKAGEEVCLNLHYLNQVGRRVPNGRGKLVVNFWTLPPTAPKIQAIENGFGSLVNGQISIPAKSSKTYRILAVTPTGARLLSLSPHFHQWGKHFTIYRWTTAKTQGEVLAELNDWDDPSYVMLDPVIDLQPGEGLLGEATYENDTDHVIRYNNDVTKGEHMAMVGTFIPLPGKKSASFNDPTILKQ
jgi:hypothetical protein